jgi:hypothetical protein
MLVQQYGIMLLVNVAHSQENCPGETVQVATAHTREMVTLHFECERRGCTLAVLGVQIAPAEEE